MGGSAFLIWGTFDEANSPLKPRKGGIVGRLISKLLFGASQPVHIGPDRLLTDIPADDLQILIHDFKDYLNESTPEPWPATKLFLDYLTSGVATVYLRGEQTVPEAPKQWYVQLSFSGCAGLAEVSAELGSHWAEIWFHQRGQAIIERRFKPVGFAPHPEAAYETVAREFLPMPELGYALYSPRRFDDTAQWRPEYAFDVDAAYLEALDPTGERSLDRLKQLEDRFSPIMADNRCRCQLCMPEFDPSSFTLRL